MFYYIKEYEFEWGFTAPRHKRSFRAENIKEQASVLIEKKTWKNLRKSNNYNTNNNKCDIILFVCINFWCNDFDVTVFNIEQMNAVTEM